MSKKKQKYPEGTIVYVTKNLPKCMSHFESGFKAIVRYTYAERYWGDDITSYCVSPLDWPEQSYSWYDEEHLTFVRSK